MWPGENLRTPRSATSGPVGHNRCMKIVRSVALLAVPVAVLIAACGGGSSSAPTTPPSSSVSTSAASTASPESALVTPANGLPAECYKPVEAVQGWLGEGTSLMLGTMVEQDLSPEILSLLEEHSVNLDKYAAALESSFPDAPASYSAFADQMRAQAEIARTWADSNTTTKNLTQALDKPLGEGEAAEAAIADLEERCAPWALLS